MFRNGVLTNCQVQAEAFSPPVRRAIKPVRQNASVTDMFEKFDEIGSVQVLSSNVGGPTAQGLSKCQRDRYPRGDQL